MVAIPAGAGISALAWPASVASAAVGNTNCPHGGNPNSSACVYGVVNHGIITTFDNEPESAPTGYHVNNSIWDYSGAPCGLWLEEGLTRGFNNDPTYRWYVAWNNSSGYAQYEEAAQSANGSSHTYEVLYGGGSNFQDYIDGNLQASVNGFGAGACIGQTGLETTGFGSAFSSGTFNHTPLKYENTSGTWETGWSTSKYWIDNPCGQQGYAPPNCLNGAFPGNSNNEWSTNQPG